MLARLRDRAHRATRDVVALYLATRDPRTPWHAKAVAACVAAYTLSPIDLIPDFVPVLGYLDDLVIVPLDIMLAVRLVPAELMAEFRREADRASARPASRAGAVMVVALWLSCAAALLWVSWPWGTV